MPRTAAASKPEDLRQAVLDASVKLIESEGLAALSLRRVAKEAGVSHQAPYHHFANREAIFAAIAHEGFAGLAHATREATRVKSARARVRAAVRAYVRIAMERPAHFRIMFRPELVNLMNHSDAKDAAHDAYAALVALGQSLKDDRVAAGLSTQAIVDTLWSACHGAASLVLDGLYSGAKEADPDAVAFGDRVADSMARLMSIDG